MITPRGNKSPFVFARCWCFAGEESEEAAAGAEHVRQSPACRGLPSQCLHPSFYGAGAFTACAAAARPHAAEKPS